MRKLILQMQMSVDGYVSPANGALEWQAWGGVTAGTGTKG